jgi:hypothetical protein
LLSEIEIELNIVFYSVSGNLIPLRRQSSFHAGDSRRTATGGVSDGTGLTRDHTSANAAARGTDPYRPGVMPVA